jgi:hypothetical protein
VRRALRPPPRTPANISGQRSPAQANRPRSPWRSAVGRECGLISSLGDTLDVWARAGKASPKAAVTLGYDRSIR